MLVHTDSQIKTLDRHPGGKGCWSQENADWIRACDTWHIQRQHAPSFGILLSILSEWAACSGVWHLTPVTASARHVPYHAHIL